jgi:hypothetical protein
VVREERGSSDDLSQVGLDEGPDDDKQELCEPSQEQVGCSGEDSVDGIANASLEINSGAGV